MERCYDGPDLIVFGRIVRGLWKVTKISLNVEKLASSSVRPYKTRTLRAVEKMACELSGGSKDSVRPFVRRICGVWSTGAEELDVINKEPEPLK